MSMNRSNHDQYNHLTTSHLLNRQQGRVQYNNGSQRLSDIFLVVNQFYEHQLRGYFQGAFILSNLILKNQSLSLINGKAPIR